MYSCSWQFVQIRFSFGSIHAQTLSVKGNHFYIACDRIPDDARERVIAPTFEAGLPDSCSPSYQLNTLSLAGFNTWFFRVRAPLNAIRTWGNVGQNHARNGWRSRIHVETKHAIPDRVISNGKALELTLAFKP